MVGKCWLSEKAPEPGVSGDAFSRRLLLPEGKTGSMHGGLRSCASGASRLGRPGRARNVGSCCPWAFDVTEMETHTRPTIN